MSRDPSVFHWRELERFERTRHGRLERCVRAQCSCGTTRIMAAWRFDSRAVLCCSQCSLRRRHAEGYANPRLVRRRRRVQP